jgi:hypothetical protein
MYRVKSKSYVSINITVDGQSMVIPPKPASKDLDIAELTQELKILQSKNVVQITKI